MTYQKVDIYEAVKYNPAAIKSSLCNPKRNRFMAKRNNLPFDILIKKYCTDSILTRMKRKVKSGIRKILLK